MPDLVKSSDFTQNPVCLVNECYGDFATVSGLSTFPVLCLALCDALNMRRRLVLCALFALFGTQMSVGETQSRCALPDGLSSVIGSKYANAHVVGLRDLNQDDQKLFQKEHGLNCPGLARFDFYGDGRPTFALVLLREGTSKAELVIAHQVQKQWQILSVDTAEASTVPVVWSEKPGKYDDVYGQKKLTATQAVVVLCAYESWAILYAWTGKQVEKIWISD